MGQMAGNIEVKNHNPDNLFIGNNKFVSGTVKLAASGTAKDGHVLSDNCWSVLSAVPSWGLYDERKLAL